MDLRLSRHVQSPLSAGRCRRRVGKHGRERRACLSGHDWEEPRYNLAKIGFSLSLFTCVGAMHRRYFLVQETSAALPGAVWLDTAVVTRHISGTAAIRSHRGHAHSAASDHWTLPMKASELYRANHLNGCCDVDLQGRTGSLRPDSPQSAPRSYTADVEGPAGIQAKQKPTGGPLPEGGSTAVTLLTSCSDPCSRLDEPRPVNGQRQRSSRCLASRGQFV